MFEEIGEGEEAASARPDQHKKKAAVQVRAGEDNWRGLFWIGKSQEALRGASKLLRLPNETRKRGTLDRKGCWR